jgi:hypothetical protein
LTIRLNLATPPDQQPGRRRRHEHTTPSMGLGGGGFVSELAATARKGGDNASAARSGEMGRDVDSASYRKDKVGLEKRPVAGLVAPRQHSHVFVLRVSGMPIGGSGG